MIGELRDDIIWPQWGLFGCQLVQNRHAGMQGTFYGLDGYMKLLKSWIVTSIQGQFQKVLNTPFLTGQKTFYGQPEAEISNASGTQRTLSLSYCKLCLQWFSFELFDILLLNLHGCEYRGRQLNCTCLQSLLSNKYRHIIQTELNWDKNPNCQKAISVRYLAWLRSWTMDCGE